MHVVHTLVRSIYSLTPKKFLQKVSQPILVGFSVLYNILKVYQSMTPGKVFFSRWRPRWLPKPFNDHNSVTINSNLMILVSIPRFLGAKNTLRS